MTKGLINDSHLFVGPSGVYVEKYRVAAKTMERPIHTLFLSLLAAGSLLICVFVLTTSEVSVSWKAKDSGLNNAGKQESGHLIQPGEREVRRSIKLEDVNIIKRERKAKSNDSVANPAKNPQEGMAKPVKKAKAKVGFNVPTESPMWVYNKRIADSLRRKMQGIPNARRNFLVTKKNTPLQTIVQYYDEKKIGSKLNVTKEVWNRFIKESPFRDKMFTTCSVVGNGGILRKSSCGKKIDSAEFIFRCNMAPLSNQYARDVGRKTNLLTINPSIIQHKYTYLNTTSRVKRFVNDIAIYGDSYLWIPAFSKTFGSPLAFTAQSVLKKQHNVTKKVVFPNPDFMSSMQDYWKAKGVRSKRPSTGLFLVSVALQMCEVVHLYGYWPFPVNRQNVTLSQHYYDNILPNSVHRLPDEFKQLQRLHNLGVLYLNTKPCKG